MKTDSARAIIEAMSFMRSLAEEMRFGIRPSRGDEIALELNVHASELRRAVREFETMMEETTREKARSSAA